MAPWLLPNPPDGLVTVEWFAKAPRIGDTHPQWQATYHFPELGFKLDIPDVTPENDCGFMQVDAYVYDLRQGYDPDQVSETEGRICHINRGNRLHVRVPSTTDAGNVIGSMEEGLVIVKESILLFNLMSENRDRNDILFQLRRISQQKWEIFEGLAIVNTPKGAAPREPACLALITEKTIHVWSAQFRALESRIQDENEKARILDIFPCLLISVLVNWKEWILADVEICAGVGDTS